MRERRGGCGNVPVTLPFFFRTYDRPQLAWPSQPKADKDLAYWRRRGQDFSVLLGYSQKGGVEMQGLAAAHGVPRLSLIHI